MLKQLSLFDSPPPLGGLDAPVLWYEGLPDRSGLARFAVALRSRFDPDRSSRKDRQRNNAARGVANADAWRGDLSGDARTWAARIVRLLRRERISRTFNALALELTGFRYTADVAIDSGAEHGLWLAVERGLLWWANVPEGDDPEDTRVRFALRAQHGGAWQYRNDRGAA